MTHFTVFFIVGLNDSAGLMHLMIFYTNLAAFFFFGNKSFIKDVSGLQTDGSFLHLWFFMVFSS